ncbi:YdhK family protein [Lentibacillus sediminis]|uniref:YdhK family protein n=1 Tax=Lentibacillus sediminis TaxID=1940529 RepID=UPI000C1BF7A9|nr:YdhK family protein [Lentibacillus sediminis]
MNKKWIIGIMLLVTIFLLAACGGGNEEAEQNGNEEEANTDEEMDMESGSGGQSDMSHSGSGEVPDDLEEAEDPAYPVGSTAIIEASHMGGMHGMQGAEATIEGAYNTTAYVVSYTPTNGGEPVENHKWVIHEELEDPGEAPLEPGTEVTLDASHMEGMDGATAEIDSAVQTTVYMVSYMPTNGGEKVSNHKWVTEDELSEPE